MILEIKDVCEAEEEFEDAITALVDAAAGERAPPRPFSDLANEAAQNVAVAYRAGHTVRKDNYWCVDKDADEAITALVETVVGDSAHGGLYGEAVDEAAQNLTKSLRAFSLKSSRPAPKRSLACRSPPSSANSSSEGPRHECHYNKHRCG